MTGRVIIVTGASSGLGYETARYLCEGGNDVVLACRNEERANKAIEKIKKQNPNALATFMQLDLADMESIRKFVDDFKATEKKLHVLINNAGISPAFKDPKKQYTKDNFELAMGTNHLGHFLLTNLLLEELKKSGSDGGDARIVTVTSSAHDPANMRRQKKKSKDLQPLDLENIFLSNDGTYGGAQAYKNSKLANLMFSYELARRLEGSGVTANAVCPGFIPTTELFRNMSGSQKFFHRFILGGMLKFTKMTSTCAQGALAICTVATDEKVKEASGKYYKDGNETKSSEESLNEENQKKLWELSGGYTRLDGYEPIEVPPPPVEEEPKKEEKVEEEAKKEEGENDEEKKEGDKEDEEAEEKKDGEEGEKKSEEIIEKKEEVEEKKEEKMDEKEPEDKEKAAE